MTLLIVIIVFGGMIFLHEFGHFIVARLFNIEVEEFGFGFPPRAMRLWRDKGSMKVGRHILEIPMNFDLPFEREEAHSRGVEVVAAQKDDKLVLKSIALGATEDGQFQPTYAEPHYAPDGNVYLSGTIQELRQGTEFTLNALPLGGFVRPKGENDPNVLDGLAAANPWKRLGVLFAGPVMNLLTAIVVTAIIIAQDGVAVPGRVLIENVSENSPAQSAGIQPNDVLLTVAGKPVSTMEDARALIHDGIDKPLEMTFERNGQIITITATPLSSRPAEQGALGIGLGSPRRPATIGEIIGGGFVYTGLQAAAIVYMPIGLIRGAINPNDARLLGLRSIYNIFGQAVQRDTESRQTPVEPSAPGQPQPVQQQPTNYILSLIASLSISLGIFNLFPIPALDGGRILFTLPEILFRRRIPYKLENVVNGVAMLILICFMLVFTVFDFINPFNLPLP